MAKGRKKPATLKQAFGQVIRYREKLGLSQMDLAVATGIACTMWGTVLDIRYLIVYLILYIVSNYGL